MRLALLFLAATACAQTAANPASIELSFPEADANSGVIPFRIGGPFLVTVTGQQAELGDVSHATVEIITGSIPTNAVASATVTLVRQEGDALAGTATLTWPPGGPAPGEAPLRVRALVGNTASPADVPLEEPALSVAPGPLSNTGAQLVQSLCFDATSTDGVLALHLTGAKLDSGMADGAIALLPGACSGTLDPRNPSSFARVKVFVTDAMFQVSATLPNTRASAVYNLTPPPQGDLTLDLLAATTTPDRESIVDLEVTARVDGNPAKDIVVTFQSIPSTTIVPALVKTDAMGKAFASFQMPKEGSLRVVATSGDVQSPPRTFGP
jgi:hypothetical protein